MEQALEVFWTLLVNYNSYLLVFSASGFLLSLLWYIVSENRKRVQAEIKAKLSEEKSFFGHFDDIENPAFKIPEFSIGRKSDQESEELKQNLINPQQETLADENKTKDTPRPKFLENLEKEIKAALPDLPEEVKKQELVEPKKQENHSETKKQILSSSESDVYEYDEEEKKVKSLLEQIKKDMREQGDQTS